MLVSFNPSLSIPNVNRKNPDKTSFQRLPQTEIDKITANAHTARTFAIDVLKGTKHLADDVKQQLRELLSSFKPDVRTSIAQVVK